MSQLKWNLSDRVIEKGLLFIWVEKEIIPQVLQVAKVWGFEYVENLVWVKLQANNHPETLSYTFFKRSKETLLIFRKVELAFFSSFKC